MSDRIPEDAYLMIIGSMKSGTSSLYDYLCSHPEICPCQDKEPEFFSTQQNHSNRAENYEALFDFDSNTHQIALEASTGYTKYPSEGNVAKRIHEYGLRPKFVYVVRNPFDRIVSHYNYMRATNEHFKANITDQYLIDCSNYLLQLNQYTAVFDKESILVVDFNRIKVEPSNVLEEIYAFVGLETKNLPSSFGAKNVCPTPSIYDQKINKAAGKPLAKLAPRFIKESLKQLLRKLAPIKTVSLDDSDRQFVFDKLKDDLIEFGECYNIDVSQWGFKH